MEKFDWIEPFIIWQGVLAIVLGYLFTALLYQSPFFTLKRPKPNLVTKWMYERPDGTLYPEPWGERELAVVIWKTTSLILAMIFFFADFAIMAMAAIKQLCLWVMQTIGLEATQVLLGVIVLILGGGAFVFKLKHQRLYGFVEVVFAGVVAIIIARQMRPGTDWSSQVATLIGTIYVVSRGLSNIKEGFKARSEQQSLTISN